MKKTAVIVSALLLAAAALLVLPYGFYQTVDAGIPGFARIYDFLHGYSAGEKGFISVGVQDSDGIVITSENPVRVKRGEKAGFTFELRPGCILRSLSDGFYVSGNRIVLDCARYPVTCVADSGPIRNCSVDVLAVDMNGNGIGEIAGCNFTECTGVFTEGTSLSVIAGENSDYIFAGYSENMPLSLGGQVFSNEKSSSITVSDNVRIFANYRKSRVTVSFAANDALAQVPESLTLKSGAAYSIYVKAREGYKITGVSAGTFENGLFSLSDVIADTEVVFSAKKLAVFSVNALSADPSKGSVTVRNGVSSAYEDSKITLMSVPAEGNSFVGYSRGLPIRDGGVILSKSAQYTFELRDDTVIYANFGKTGVEEIFFEDPAAHYAAPADKWLLFYHPNGGINTETGTGVYRTESFSREFYHCPNTPWGSGGFTRDGYSLIGYNTKPDGSGKYYGLGWNVVMPESGTVNLYCVWAKNSDIADFRYKVEENRAIITAYTGKDGFLVIPDSIGSFAVEALASGFLVNNKTVESLYIPASVKTLESKAVVSCDRLKSVYFSDTAVSVGNEWYSKCAEFSTVYMLAQRPPSHTKSYSASCAVKFERIQTVKGPKMIIIGGSNVLEGVITPQLQDKLKKAGYDYTVINLGINAADCILFYLEFVSHFVDDKDIIVHCPETHEIGQFGSNEIITTHWSYFEGAYEVLSYVDIRNYANIFGSFGYANSGRNEEHTYEDYATNGYRVNTYGDFSYPRPQTYEKYMYIIEKSEADGYGDYGYETAIAFLGNTVNVGRLNRAYDMCAEKGCTMLLSFGVLYDKISSPDTQNENSLLQKKYMQTVDERLHILRISVPHDYLFSSEYIYDSPFHLNDKGAPIRTDRLGDDIIGYFRNLR